MVAVVLLHRPNRFLKAVREWSRPVRVAGHAIADVRKTKGELIAENALLRQQLIAAKRHLGRPQLAKPEKLAITLWSHLSTQWQSTLLRVPTRLASPQVRVFRACGTVCSAAALALLPRFFGFHQNRDFFRAL